MKTTSKLILFAWFPALLQLTGCASYYGPQREAEMRRQTAINNVNTDLQRLQQRVEGLVAAQEELFTGMDVLQASTTRATAEQNRALAELSQQVQATSAARMQLKKEILDGLTARMTEVIRTQKPASRARTQRGYEHVVEPGQTISEIAAAYNVTIDAIANANDLRDPNQIRAGQSLFIPE